MRGRFITFEGGEGVGKSTQILRLADWLRARDRDVVLTREPGGTPRAEQLRRMLLEEHTRYLPVMDGSTLMGVVSFYDVAKAVLEEQSYENRMLKAYIRDWPEQEQVGN